MHFWAFMKESDSFRRLDPGRPQQIHPCTILRMVCLSLHVISIAVLRLRPCLLREWVSHHYKSTRWSVAG